MRRRALAGIRKVIVVEVGVVIRESRKTVRMATRREARKGARGASPSMTNAGRMISTGAVTGRTKQIEVRADERVGESPTRVPIIEGVAVTAKTVKSIIPRTMAPLHHGKTAGVTIRSDDPTIVKAILTNPIVRRI